jgi:acetate CoA/acetoacetate CoA-transferase alpha subunit
MSKRIVKPVMSAREAVAGIADGATVHDRGFNYGGVPYTLVRRFLNRARRI